ncbi:hypothetical protein SBOR_8898 [Sclerotinia borealis F-4128]|uniref:Uncharacterized protein n=1 Tax=Sclerotinia borealis (strain F-4128) TaxID=1432307 RepID=W9C735_SCLBF|nr:hypothetical protein SBOR_8898 [Sclerotinia borealis F-4128]
MSDMYLRCDSPKPLEEPPSKRQKIAEIKDEDFENKLTIPIALELGEESRDLELKLSEKCLAFSRCDIAQPAKCQCRCCLYTKYGHVVFLPHDSHQDGEEGPGEKCAECISVEGTVIRGQYAVEISDPLPLSPEVRHDLAYHFRVFREILSTMFSTTIQDLRKRMAQVKIESMPALQEEMLGLQKEIKESNDQLDALGKELERIFTTMMMNGVDPLETKTDLSTTNEKNLPTLVHLRKAAVSSAESSLKEEVDRLKMENARLETKVRKLEEENVEMKQYGVQSVQVEFYNSDEKSDS